MFSINPFAALSSSVAPIIMQSYVVIMVLLVALGTIYDTIHRGSAKYFFSNWGKAKKSSSRTLGGGEMVGHVVRTAVANVALSSEFCNQKRRIAHLLGMWGFTVYAVATAVMVFQYPTPTTPTPAIIPQLWWVGAAMVCVGGYWFWFFIRVDVLAEGGSPFRLMRADLFVVLLMSSCTLALIWAYLQGIESTWANVALGLYLILTTALFGSVPWTKFAHMFFKPAAALQKRVAIADGSRSNLPEPADKPAILGDPRRHPSNY